MSKIPTKLTSVTIRKKMPNRELTENDNVTFKTKYMKHSVSSSSKKKPVTVEEVQEKQLTNRSRRVALKPLTCNQFYSTSSKQPKNRLQNTSNRFKNFKNYKFDVKPDNKQKVTNQENKTLCVKKNQDTKIQKEREGKASKDAGFPLKKSGSVQELSKKFEQRIKSTNLNVKLEKEKKVTFELPDQLEHENQENDENLPFQNKVAIPIKIINSKALPSGHKETDQGQKIKSELQHHKEVQLLRTMQPRFNDMFYEDPFSAKIPIGVNDTDLKYNIVDSFDMDTISENFNYLKFLEHEKPIFNKFLSSGVPNQRQRTILFEWLQKCHEDLKLKRETLYLAINILDRYIDLCNNPIKLHETVRKLQKNSDLSDKLKSMIFSGLSISKKNLQLVGVTAFVLATKIEELQFPILDDWVWLSDSSISKNEIIDMEYRIWTCLDFDLGQPGGLAFLRRFSLVANCSNTVHVLGKYLLETAMYDAELCTSLASEKAAGCLYLAMLLEVSDTASLSALEKREKMGQIWTEELNFQSGYNKKDLIYNIKRLSKILIEIKDLYQSHQNGQPLKGKEYGLSIFKKYLSDDNLNVSVSSLIMTRSNSAVRINCYLERFSKGKFECMRIE